MPSSTEHLAQARRNLLFVSRINNTVGDCTDWQVTVCFYTALHVINAHLSQFGLQYRNHTDVDHALNPKVLLSLSKVDDDAYVAYCALQSLSRRARYLVNEKNMALTGLIHEKHLARAIRHLDTIFKYFSEKYEDWNFEQQQIGCEQLNFNGLTYFRQR